MTTQNQYLFNRAWSVAIGLASNAAPPGNNTQTARVYSSFSVDGVQSPSPLRVVFDIDLGSSASANKAKIDIYNLSAASRLLYQQANPEILTTGYQIAIQAGYNSLGGAPDLVRTIYVGDIRRATNRRVGQEIITSFECGAVEKSLLFTTYDFTYPAGTTLIQILQGLANTLGIPLGSCVGIPAVQYNYGYTASGAIKDTLEHLLSSYGLEFSIQNNSLQIKPVGSANNTQIIILSNQTGPGQPGLTGLIGVPSENQGITQFTSLLNPAIFPGSAVRVYSENINGDYFQVRRAHFLGDSHGDKWQVECEGLPLQTPGQVLTGNKGNTLQVDANTPAGIGD